MRKLYKEARDWYEEGYKLGYNESNLPRGLVHAADAKGKRSELNEGYKHGKEDAGTSGALDPHLSRKNPRGTKKLGSIIARRGKRGSNPTEYDSFGPTQYQGEEDDTEELSEEELHEEDWKKELRGWYEDGYIQGSRAAKYTDVSKQDFREVGIKGETWEDLLDLEWEDAVSILESAAYESEMNSRQYAGHPTYNLRYDEEGLEEEAYDAYSDGVTTGIKAGAEDRLLKEGLRP